jgi:2-oxoglutarate ferredoxin oxidoreductase subunit alpha
LNNIEVTNPILVDAPYETPDVLIIGMGSTGGTIDEARGRLEKDGSKTNHITIRLIHPFPTKQLAPYLEKAKKIVVVENNATAQLASQIKLHAGFRDKINNLLKYDGNPFLPKEIYEYCKEVL